MWIALGHVGLGVVVFLLAVRYKRRWYARRRLVSAALAVVNDHRERARLYPGFYHQPHLLKVMNDLDTAIAVHEHGYRVREAKSINALADELKSN
jgi:hypothetical protein